MSKGTSTKREICWRWFSTIFHDSG